MNIQKSVVIKDIKAQARKNHTPLFGTFELTARCNLNCKMCYIHNQDTAALKSELSTDQWKAIMSDAIQSGMLFALLTGGECLLRKDFKELYLFLYNQGVMPSVNTNGVLLDEEMAQFFSEYPPERIQISLYGSNEDGYEAVTERRSFAKVIAGLDALEKYHITPRIAITPNGYMLNDFSDVFRFVLSRKLPYRVNTELIEPRDGEGNTEAYLTIQQQISLSKERKAIKGKPLFQPPVQVPLPGCDCEEQLYGSPCNAGTIRFAVTSDGRMIPCTSIADISIDMLSNSFSDCWKYITKKMSEVVVPSECTDCAYKKHCIFCPAVRYDGLYSGKCNKKLCELCMARYREGLFRL